MLLSYFSSPAGSIPGTLLKRCASWLAGLAMPAVGMLALLAAVSPALWGQTSQETTAWQAGRFQMDRQGMVERSDIILEKPNLLPKEAMPLGNGRLGLAVWAEDGYTAQLNRGDTFPHRLSAGQVVVPGLARMTQAADFSGRLSLYDGELQERGGGMTATTYVTEAQDAMVVQVTGADPKAAQTAELRLWSPRRPQVLHAGTIGALAETWVDDKEAGASGSTFGSLAAITADGADVRVEHDSPLSVKITFRPHADGTFRVIIASPAWHGGDVMGAAARLIGATDRLSPAEHRTWWHQFWEHAALMRLASADHAAEYFENLRLIDLYTAAAESRDRLPGSQAGIGDLFSAFRDAHQWGPSAYWHWNLRMQVSANLGAGVFALNDSYFNLYRDNLPVILAWTQQHMHRAGACVPETMRFNGRGYENETWTAEPAIDCGEDFHPYYNARTLSTGAEVSLWIWRQYLYTDDLAFLRRNYPVMRESARFLLAYAKPGADGLLHTFPSNAHETEWDVHDPATDICAMRTLFPEVIEAAALLKTDDALADELKSALTHVPAWPVIRLSDPKTLAGVKANDPDTILIASHDPAAPVHNSENVGLEPVWPYGLIGDDSPLHALAVRTWEHRPNRQQNDWSADPEQAAYLGLADEVRSSLLALTEHYQAYPSGLASFVGAEFYVEQIGVVADALESALVQDADDVVRIAPAWPRAWDADATVAIQHRSRVDVQIRHGAVVTVGIETGASRVMRVRNPWPGEPVEVVDASSGATVVTAAMAPVLAFQARAGGAYLIRPAAQSAHSLLFQAITGTPAEAPKILGARSIGIPK